MSLPQKAFFSLLVSLVLFAGVSALLGTDFFNMAEVRFYNPSVRESVLRETARDAEMISHLLSGLEERFSAVLDNSAVRSGFNPIQNDDDIYERSRVFGKLVESTSSLISVRLLDPGGRKIHFSTYYPDVVQSNEFLAEYQDYSGRSDILFSPLGQAKLVLDRITDVMIFSLPVYDLSDSFAGVALFTVSAGVINETLAAAGRSGFRDSIVLCPAGIINGVSAFSGSIKTRDDIIAGISKIWAGKIQEFIPFTASDVAHVLVSFRIGYALYYGKVFNEEILVLPGSIKVAIIFVIYFTLYLIVFLLFSFLKSKKTTPLHNVDSPAGSDAAFPAPGGTLSSAEIEELEPFYEPVQDTVQDDAANEIVASDTVMPPVPLAQKKEGIPLRGEGLLAVAQRAAYNTERHSAPHAAAQKSEPVDNIQFEVVTPFSSIIPETDVAADVIVEKDGIPYISSITLDDNPVTEVSSDFIELIDSVTGKP